MLGSDWFYENKANICFDKKILSFERNNRRMEIPILVTKMEMKEESESEESDYETDDDTDH